MTFNPTYLLEIEKFIQSKRGKRISTPKRLLKGSFRNVDSKEIYEGDEFMAYPVNRGDALETYQEYIAYFNYTIQDKYEEKRIAVSAEWVGEKEYFTNKLSKEQQTKK